MVGLGLRDERQSPCTGSVGYRPVCGGSFTTAGGVPANYIAKWNGSTWSALGSGMNRAVDALAVSGSDLYAGGSFTTAGDKVSACVAKAELEGQPTSARDSEPVCHQHEHQDSRMSVLHNPAPCTPWSQSPIGHQLDMVSRHQTSSAPVR